MISRLQLRLKRSLGGHIVEYAFYITLHLQKFVLLQEMASTFNLSQNCNELPKTLKKSFDFWLSFHLNINLTVTTIIINCTVLLLIETELLFRANVVLPMLPSTSCS